MTTLSNFSRKTDDEYENIRCKKCGRVIFCGDLNMLCKDPECELKLRYKKESK